MDRDTEMPPVNVRRWTVRRKAAVVYAVRNGLLSVEEAAKRYSLSREELQAWERDLERHGLYGLRAKQVQAHRPIKRSRSLLHRGRARAESKSRSN
jgi:transposase